MNSIFMCVHYGGNEAERLGLGGEGGGGGGEGGGWVKKASRLEIPSSRVQVLLLPLNWSCFSVDPPR